MPEPLRLTEILTTSTAVANYLGQPVVTAEHLLAAIGILQGKKALDDLGRPQSPLVSRMTKAGSGVAPEIQALAQRWFAVFDNDVLREFSEEQLNELVRELEALGN